MAQPRSFSLILLVAGALVGCGVLAIGLVRSPYFEQLVSKLAGVEPATAATTAAAMPLTKAAPGAAPIDDSQIAALREAAMKDDANAQLALGKALGVRAESAAEALTWLRAAAEQRSTEAQRLAATAFAEGRGTARNPAEALRWYRSAADAGDAHAQYEAAILLSSSPDIPGDDREALKWLRRAAAQGHAAAKSKLAELLAAGRGGPPPATVANSAR